MKHRQKNRGRCLSILGTGSDVGKSVVVTALCRIFKNRGVRVAPYKAQNMSNNSYVTAAGGEMGRAQVAQAEAAGVPLSVDMNPVLLKPSADTGAQVVVHGKPIGNRSAADYFADTNPLFDKARESLERLRAAYDLIVMEGAGSCGEVNLRERDFVNFRIAHAVDAPVILVADIDRGGVFAQIIGTLAIIPKKDRKRVKGFIINRFRGDADLFSDGISYIEENTGLPVLGLIPYYRHIEIDSEDGMPLDVLIDPSLPPDGKINAAVIRLPHISNFTDFAPLCRETSVCLHYLARARPLSAYDIVFLPGSKNVRADLAWMRQAGWEPHIKAYRDQGGRIGGICGGYQMLGLDILDPHGVEGDPGAAEGLGFLDITTTLYKEKVLTRSTGTLLSNGIDVDGYEIHMGLTRRLNGISPLINIISRNREPVDDPDGAVNGDGKIWGTYLHGLFDNPVFRSEHLNSLVPGACDGKDDEAEAAFKNRQYDLLAEHFSENMNLPGLLKILDTG